MAKATVEVRAARARPPRTAPVAERTILSTAPLRGPGPRGPARPRRAHPRPVDRPPAAAALQRRAAGRAGHRGGRHVLICEADSCKGPVLDLPLEAIGSTRGDPTNVDLAGATAKGIPVLRAPGPQRRRRGRAGRRPAPRRHPRPARRRPRRADRRGVPGRLDPLPALPGLAARRPDRRHRRPRRRGPGHQVAPRGPRHAGDHQPTRSPPTPPTRSTTCWPRPTSCRCTRRSRPTRAGS